MGFNNIEGAKEYLKDKGYDEDEIYDIMVEAIPNARNREDQLGIDYLSAEQLGGDFWEARMKALDEEITNIIRGIS